MKPTHTFVAWLVAAFLLSTALVAPSFWFFKQTKEAAEARILTSDLIARAHDVVSSLMEAETGQRGYLLTGDEVFLQPYTAVRDSIRDQVITLCRLTILPATQDHLDKVAPLIDAKLAYFSKNIELRRNNDTVAALANVRGSQGRPLIDSIREEMGHYIQIEQGSLSQRETRYQSTMRRLFTVIVMASLLTLLFALTFVYMLKRGAQQRIKNSVHLETQRLLQIQEETNKQLQLANMTLQISDEKLSVTLNSIGDGVIATDAEGGVSFLNPLAQQLTGWTQAEAFGHSVDEIFHIINQETRQPAAVPVKETLEKGTKQGLANHTVLISREGRERAIADSCAPIRNRDGQVVGAVLVFRDVTEEYAVQRALHDNATLTQTILNTVADGIITFHASGGIVETVNPAALQMFDYTATEIIGQNVSRLISELGRDTLSSIGEKVSAGDQTWVSGFGREIEGRRKDGSSFPLELALSEMWMGGQRHFTGIVRDNTARKQAEAALLKAGALQAAIFNSANFSSIATDARGVIQIFNVGAERMLGYVAADVMNKITPADISDPQEVIARAKSLSSELGTPITPGFEALVFKASRGIEDIYELTYIRKDGSRFPAVVSVTALRDAQNTIIGYLLIGTDNTARKQIEDERKRLDQLLQGKNVELERAKSVAERANLAKSDFLSSMSHELRSPLNAILGFAQLMESATPPPNPNQMESISQILQAGWHLLKLINEILDLAMIESGRVSLSPESVSLSEVLSECRTMMEPQAQQRGIRMTFSRFDHPVYVKADRTRVKQIIINLLSNAIKYNKDQGTVIVDCTERAPKRIRISVADTGVGLSPDKLAQLFRPFNRLGQEAGSVAGTGIGLVVTKRLAELMDGVLGVESKVGEGSVFWCELIASSAPELIAEHDETAAFDQPALPTSARRPTLLYVEDNPANMKLVEQLIERRPDIALLTAVNGTLGLELARTRRPTLILMDIHLPGISGIEVLKMLRADPGTAHIPVVALSANAMPRDIEMGLELGFFRYLTKPIKVKEFMETLNVALEYAEKGKS